MDFLEWLLSNLGEDANKDEVKKKLEEHVSAEIASKTPGLAKNKEDILNEKKSIQEEFEKYKGTYAELEKAGVTVETFTALKAENDKLKALDKSPEDIKERETAVYEQGKTTVLAQMEPKVKAEAQRADFAEKQLKDFTKKYIDYRAEASLREAVQSMDLKDDYMWFQGLKSNARVEYSEQEDKLDIQIMAGSQGYVPISDWKNYYPTTDEGKDRKRAPRNHGGQAPGSSYGGKKGSPDDNAYAKMFVGYHA